MGEVLEALVRSRADVRRRSARSLDGSVAGARRTGRVEPNYAGMISEEIAFTGLAEDDGIGVQGPGIRDRAKVYVVVPGLATRPKDIVDLARCQEISKA